MIIESTMFLLEKNKIKEYEKNRSVFMAYLQLLPSPNSKQSQPKCWPVMQWHIYE
jgi:hypothetical protein